MSHAIAFDTLAFTKKLKSAGFTEQQSETLAEAQAELIEERLATKQDIKMLEVTLRRDMKELETKLEAHLIKWMIGVAGGQAALIVALLKMLP